MRCWIRTHGASRGRSIDAKPARLRSEPRARPRPAHTRRAFALLRDHTSPSEQHQAVLLQEVAQE